MNRSELDKILKYHQQQKSTSSRFTVIKQKPKVPVVKKIDRVTLAKIKYYKSKEKRQNFKSMMIHNIGMMTIDENNTFG